MGALQECGAPSLAHKVQVFHYTSDLNLLTFLEGKNMSLFDSLKGKAKEAMKNEDLTDKVLDKAEQAATTKMGEDKADKISKAREAVDNKVGDNTPAQEEN